MSMKENALCNVYSASRRHNDYQPFGDICETVQAHYGTGGGNVPIVIEEERMNEAIVVLENHPADSRVKICKDCIVQTLSSRMATCRWSWNHNALEMVNLIKPGYKTRLER